MATTKIRVTKTVVPTEGDKPVDNTIRQGWNDYVNWLAAKGLKGHPSLDKNDLGGQMIDQYRKENPNSPITREIIPTIQKEFGNYRNYVLQQVAVGKAQLPPGLPPENFMKSLSIVDGIPGQRTTSFQFPSEYLQTFNNGKNLGVVNKGFATPTK